ncbi:contractile injection system protein, VgrG/Pvc8 family [Dryocola clanedunensis]|uniref:contractile injection system protein, VgrG/Pvc8 family n=1 Tax=Cedecea sulfonylureivorans TaxID=3051154 RepID=UPI00192804EE|nr:contractile injection system protein, VgrG/Pvc8 family [Cedecea sulfonylureivorans]
MTDNTSALEYSPDFSVIAEGKDITRALQQSLTELTLTDNGGATAKSDELKITLLSETLKLPSKGARLRLALGFNGQLVDKGWFVVCSVSSSGPPRKIDIYATAAPMNAEKQQGDVLAHKNRSWDGVTLGEIVKTVATDNGLLPRVAASLMDIQIPHLDQVAESDANLMTRLAHTYSAVSKPAGGYWLFLEQGAAVNASGKSAATITITPEELSTWSYSEGSRGNSTGKTTAGSKKNSGKIGVNYYNEQDGRTNVSTVEHDGPTMLMPWTQPGKAQADHHAQSRKTQANRNERKMTIAGPCRPKHVPLTAECQVKTSGFGEREDGQWLTESLVYTLGPSGFSFTWNLVVNIKAKQAKSKSQKSGSDKTGPNYYG